jgi:uncharacterized protein (TIGR00369 family)
MIDDFALNPPPVYRTTGMTASTMSLGRVSRRLPIGRWATDANGIVPGVLAILCDGAIGTSIMSLVPRRQTMTTSHLHLEFLHSIRPDTAWLECEGVHRFHDSAVGLGEGMITDDRGVVIARSSIGAVFLERSNGDRPRAEDYANAEQPEQPEQSTLASCASLDELLGCSVVSAGDGFAELAVRARPGLANHRGDVHGGVGALIGERAIDVAVRNTRAELGPLRIFEMRVAFLRSLPANDGLLTCRATVAFRGRRLAATRSELLTADGRPAVVVDVTHVAIGEVQ